MVNNFTDEKSQQVYCLIDKGRVMKMPFDGMSLLDYAINATLVLSRVALVRQDKAGLLTFSDQVGTFLPAGRKTTQMGHILEILFNQQTRFQETDYEKLHAMVRTRITQRSLIVLFTNFESLTGLQRQLPFIRSIARQHLVLVVFFREYGAGSAPEHGSGYDRGCVYANDRREICLRKTADRQRASAAWDCHDPDGAGKSDGGNCQ